MSITRAVGRCEIGADWCSLGGLLHDVPFTGGSCPTAVDIDFWWTTMDAALTTDEQAQVAAVWSMLKAYLLAEEPCADMRTPHSFRLTLGGGGLVRSAGVVLDGPVVAGKQRQLRSSWGKSRDRDSIGSGRSPRFTADDITALDAVVAMLNAYLEAEEPL